MNTLDTPPVTDPSTISFTETAIRYGLIGGLITIIYALLGIVTGFTNPSSGIAISIIAGIISFVIFIVVIVKGVGQHRDKELGGLISFGRAFLVGLVIALIMALLGKVFNYIYFNYIDPEYLANAVEGIREMYENMGMDESMIDASMEAAEEGLNQQKTLLGGLPMIAGMSAIVSAIIALIMKKSPSID